MTTFVICKNCGKKFKSPIQVVNLEKNVVENNYVDCPHCNKQTLTEKDNMVNE